MEIGEERRGSGGGGCSNIAANNCFCLYFLQRDRTRIRLPWPSHYWIPGIDFKRKGAHL